MAEPPKLKRLRPEDFDFEADASEWGPKLLLVLTQFCTEVTEALTGRLTRPQNVRGEEWEVAFTTPNPVAIDAAPFPLAPIKPKYTLAPRHVWVTFAEDITDATRAAPLASVSPVWHLNSDGNVVFRLFHGLDTERRYRIRGLME